MFTQKYFEFLEQRYSAAMIMINYHHGDDDVDQRKFVKTNRREQKFPEFSFFIKGIVHNFFIFGQTSYFE